eukprot:4878474-Pyramimonas_sp.AAC.1
MRSFGSRWRRRYVASGHNRVAHADITERSISRHCRWRYLCAQPANSLNRSSGPLTLPPPPAI